MSVQSAREAHDPPSPVRAGESARETDSRLTRRSGSRLKRFLATRVSSTSTQLPPRYHERWRDAFDFRVQPSLVPGVRVLDVGSGRTPTVPPEQRPAGCWYAGLDLSLAELQKAPEGSYDEMHVADVARRIPELEGRFDLVISWQVLEHVKPLGTAMESLRAYLRPGGRLVVLMSGTYSLFGLINQIIPQRLGVWAMKHLLDRDPDTVFPAYYHQCYDRALRRILSPWHEYEIVPRYAAARYWAFCAPIQRAYLSFENWACRAGHNNLATHYLVAAAR